jgi:ABC-2 type transport system permease protein
MPMSTAAPAPLPSIADRSTVTVVLATARREMLISRSYRAALVLDVVGAVFGILLYYFLSRALRANAGQDLQGAGTYFAFALVGVVLTTILQTTALSIGRRLREEQLTGTLEAVLAQPARSTDIAFGLACYPIGFAAARSCVYLVVGGLLLDADFSNADWLGWLAILLTTTAFLLGVGLTIAAFVLWLKRAEVIAGFATSMLAIAGGAYFPIEAFPPWLRWIGYVVPTRYVFQGARQALYIGSGWADDALLLTAFACVSVPLGAWLFARSVARQRRAGGLLEY